MPTQKLTKSAVARLRAPDPSGRQVLHWDTELKGFGVLCSGRTEAKTYVVQRSVNGRKRRVALGAVAEFERVQRKGADGKMLRGVELARHEAADAIHEMRRGKDPKAKDYGDVTLQQALDDCLAKRPNLSDRSRSFYRKNVEGWFRAWLNRPLREISADMIEARFHAIKKEAGASWNKRERPDLYQSDPGAAAANAALRSLRAVWHFAQGLAPDLPPWPAARLKGQWYRVPRRRRSVKLDDLKTFYAAANETDEEGKYTLGRGMRDLALLMLFTGFRSGEACSLRWDYVDFGARVIRLPYKATKTKVPLDLPTSDLVHELLVARQSLGKENDYVFPGPGSTGHVVEPKKAFDALGKRCGFPINPHALRATFITVVDNTPGVTPLAASALVNHALDTGSVHTGYVQEVELRRAAQAVARSLKRRCGITTPRGKNVSRLGA